MGQDDRQQHIPNWLRQMSGWEETPDWLLRFIEQSEGSLSLDDLGGGFGAEAFGGSADETAMDGELAQAGEWFDRLSDGEADEEQAVEEPAPTPTVSESGEDWLSEMTEVFDTSIEASGGDDSLDWLDQIQSSQDEALPAVGGPEETGSLFEAAPEGISGEGPLGGLEETEPAQEDVPEWLSGLDQGFPEDEETEEPLPWGDTEETSTFEEVSDADAEVPSEEEEVEETGTGGLPDWLVGEGEGEPEMPDWMAGLGEGEAAGDDTADWLSQIEAAEQEAEPAEPTAVEPALPESVLAEIASEEPFVPESPDWLTSLAEDTDVPLAEEPAGEALEGDAEDWLSEIVPDEQEAPAPLEPTPEAASVSESPDWLTRLAEEAPLAEEPAGEALESEPADWLSEIVPDEQETPAPVEPTPEAASVSESPDWLTGLAEDTDVPLAEEPAGEALESEPADWLSEIVPDEQETSAPLEPTPEAASVSESPDWLTGLAEDTDAPLAEEPAGETPEGGLADWLSEIVPDEQEEPTAAALEPEDVSAETPDWLGGLGEEAPLAEEASVELVDEGIPDWLSETVLSEPEEAAPESVSESVSTPVSEAPYEAPDWLGEPEPAPDLASETVDGVPDWLSEPESAAELAPEIAAEEDAPAWLLETREDEVRERTDISVPEGASPVAEASAPAEAPDWLARLSVDAPAQEAAGSMDDGAPDWLSDLQSPTAEAPAAGLVQPTPDWLSAIEVKATEAPAPQGAPAEVVGEQAPVETGPALEIEAETPEPEIEPDMFDEGAPDWLVDAGEMPSLETDTSTEESEDGVPAWLSDLDMDAEAQVESALDEPSPAGLEEPVASVPDDEAISEDESASGEMIASDAAGQDADLPNWLVNVDQHLPVETEAPVLAEAPLGLSEEPVPTDEVEEEGPGWLEDVGDMSASTIPQERKGVTAWLQDVQDMPVPEETVSEQGGDDVEMPSWLQDMDLGTTESEEAPGTVSESLEDMPDWLREMPQEDISGVSVDTAAEAAPSAPSTLGETSMQGAPSWMQEVYEVAPSPVPDALGLPAQEEAASEEAPEWLDALREQDQEPEEDQLPVETSGPLAGLRGVLNPEPLLAILPKATYKPIPPVGEAQQSEAQRVAELLAQPVRRTTISTRSPGRAILASLGRWLVYIALVAVMLVAPLQSWVRPPVRSEAQGFYYAIDALQPGSEVLLVTDYDASLDGELTPQLRAIVWHLLHKNLGIVFLSLNAQGPAIVRDVVNEIPSAIAGEHYLDLGYVPANPAALRGFVHNPIAGASTLISGAVAPADTTLGQRISSFDDLDLIVTVTGDHTHVQWWIEQVGTQTRVDLLAAVSTSAVPYLMPYYDARGTGQLAGILSGLSGAVQYEQMAAGQVAPNAWPNYVVLVNAQMLLVVIVLVSGVSSIVSGIVQRARRSK